MRKLLYSEYFYKHLSAELGQFLPRCMHCSSSHEKAVRQSVRPSVCLSVYLSNEWIVTKQKKKFCPDFYTIWKIVCPRFLRRIMVGGGEHCYLKFWVKLAPLERKRRFSTKLVRRLYGQLIDFFFIAAAGSSRDGSPRPPGGHPEVTRLDTTCRQQDWH